MQGIQFSRFGEHDIVEYLNPPGPTPQGDNLLTEVAAAEVNCVDFREGLGTRQRAEAHAGTQQSPLESDLRPIPRMMASFISHDLRHHLSSIYCNVEFMSEPDTCHEERQQLLEEVRSAIENMTDLLDSFLLHVRTGNSLRPRLDLLNLLIERVIGRVRSHPDARGVRLSIKEALPIRAWVDSKRLGSAVYNLVLNACQAAKRGAGPVEVAVALLQDDDSIVIRVEDTGPGVPDHIRMGLLQALGNVGKEGKLDWD